MRISITFFESPKKSVVNERRQRVGRGPRQEEEDKTRFPGSGKLVFFGLTEGRWEREAKNSPEKATLGGRFPCSLRLPGNLLLVSH